MLGILDDWLKEGWNLRRIQYCDDGLDFAVVRFNDANGDEICMGYGWNNQQIAQTAQRDYWVIAEGMEE